MPFCFPEINKMEGAMVGALTGVMNSLLSKLGGLLGNEYRSLKGVRKEIKFLENELCSMNALLQRLADKEEIDVQTKEWRDRVRELAYDIEDCIDLFLHHLNPIDGKAGFAKKVAQQLKRLQVSYGITQQIKDLKARVIEESERHKRYNLNVFRTNSEADQCTSAFSSRVRIDPRLSALYVETERLVGIDGPRNKITRWLMEKQGNISEHLRTMSIVGCGGMGKTTLANQVYLECKARFECSAFVTVSRNPNMKLILMKTLSDIGVMSGDVIEDEQYLINKLRGYLQDKRYFIVVDDIWDAHTWRVIQCALFKNSCGSRIITTTRIYDVAKLCSSSHTDQIHEMKYLSAGDSKSLFFRRIFSSDERCPPQFKEISDDILKKCGGLPLAIISVSSLLASKPVSRDQWDNVKNHVTSAYENNHDIEIMRWVLSLSYFNLPHHLKTCLLYLSVFPEDYVITKDRLVSRWIAEGFIHGKHEQCLYEVAESYFNTLINRSLIQPANIKDDGQVNACRVHDIILDFIVSRSIEENFVTPFGASVLKSIPLGKIRRLSLHDKNEESAIIPTNLVRCHVRSLTIFVHDGLMPPLLGFHGLRVLDLENCNALSNHHLRNIGRMVQLRYLNIKGTNISQLPRQIGELQYLETLDIRSTDVRGLPSTLAGLQRLVRLLADYTIKLPEGIGNLQALEELSCFSVFMYPAIFLRELGQLINLRVLRVIWNCTEFEGDAEGYMDKLSLSLSKLSRLQSLFLDIHGHVGGEFSLDLWHPAPNRLRKFSVDRWHPISKIPRWIISLINLEHLNLYVRKISQEDFEMFEDMPMLLTLILSSEAAIEERLIISCQGFQSLTYFKMHCDRVGLIFEPRSMPKLEHLHIVISAFQMKSLDGCFDFGIQNLSCLTKIYVYINCYGLTDEEVEAAETSVMTAVDTIPKHPRLHIDRRFAPL
ncbi:hypothetical protein U9M48_026171 [Paspalum notatum var. saurae]|uniref:Uncharacterized protein n=1 Tax=Paspalum notatum var. saurae TaxID=547442 RepID=A0AAQ3TRM6_PASNO